MSHQRGQALIVMIGAIFMLVVGASVLAAFGFGYLGKGRGQRASDLAALSAARVMRENYNRLFVPAYGRLGRPNPQHLEKYRYLQLARRAACKYAKDNGATDCPRVDFPDSDSFAPTQVRVRILESVSLSPGGGSKKRRVEVSAAADAELVPPSGYGWSQPDFAVGGGYDGRLVYRQGKPMRPDVALAFDRMAAAAQKDGAGLIINSAYRSDAEQAILWRKNPDPKWVARPGTSLHRNATEIDLGPPASYGWLATNAKRFGFVQRYSWEAWHYGYMYNPRSTPTHLRGAGKPAEVGGEGGSAMPSFVPSAYASAIAHSASRQNVSAALLAAQLYAESNFNPFASSSAGAQGIAQFMPSTARAYDLKNPYDAKAAIAAQARMMRELLQRFSSVPLALAAYNAGPARVAACGCVPNIPETQAYVAKILALMGGTGEIAAPAMDVKLVA